METLQKFLERRPSYNEIVDMHDANSIKNWDAPHPHGMELLSGDGPSLYGRVKDKTGDVKWVSVADCHGQILCNLLGYGNEEIEGARAKVKEYRPGLDTVSNNFLSDVVEWTRAVIAESLKPMGDYDVLFVASGTEANDAIRRAARAITEGQAAFINLREGYSGSGVAANAACGHPAWRANSTFDIPGMYFTDPNPEDLQRVLRDIPKGRAKVYTSEAANKGVGGFGEIPDAFLRYAAEMVRADNRGLVGMDEVQTGVGRTGRSLWASETIYNGMKGPDMISMAKGLGNGHRAAVMAVLKEHSPKIDGLTYHTFGQTIEDLAVMGTVLQVVQRDNLTENARIRGEEFKTGLEEMKSRVPFSFEVQGRGLMVGIVLDTAKRVNAVLKNAPLEGWIPGKGGVNGNILRVAPPINIDSTFVKSVLRGIEDTFRLPEVEAAQ